MSRTSFTFGAALLSSFLLGCHDAANQRTRQQIEADAPTIIQVQSEAFAEGQPIPRKYATDDDLSPPISWSNLPPDTRSVVLLMEDPDAPGDEPFVHWIVFNMPPSLRALPEGQPHESKLVRGGDAMQGVNSMRKIGYYHLAPPPGKPHRYFFHVYAVDRPLKPDADTTRDDLFKQLDGHILAKGRLTGTYQHP
jgi:Raf kinase inhibitor-like YbhB/YbcL family protein